jgi:glycosyl transferase, family 25
MLAANVIQAFAISLTSARRRRADLKACLEGNIVYEIIDAIAGADLRGHELEYCKELYSPRLFRRLTLNELGCSLSHRKALRRFLETPAQFALILEDDAHIVRDDFPKMVEVLSSFTAFDILKVGGNGRYVVDSVKIGTFGSVDVHAVTKVGAGANAYIVSRMGAQKLVDSIVPIREHYDAYLRNLYRHRCSVFETSPRLTTLQPECTNSTIGGDRKTYRYSKSVRRNLQAAAYRARHNCGVRMFNFRRFGWAYLFKSGFSKLVLEDPILRHSHDESSAVAALADARNHNIG